MNYTRIYASIVLRAQSERTERLALKKQGKYFEDHHIIPRSLGGKDTISNMALLTGREHFICHWLLVKIYAVGSIERSKMVLALWRMQSQNKCHTERYINSRVYEYLRTEFAKYIGTITSVTQSGSRNSQYGKSWYTNCYTGECVTTRTELCYPWVKGRFLFRGESSKLNLPKETQKLYVPIRKVIPQNQTCPSTKSRVQYVKRDSVLHAQQLWDKYHNGSYSKLEEFGNEIGISKVAVYNWFKKYIPLYRMTDKAKRKHYPSNKSLVGIYQ